MHCLIVDDSITIRRVIRRIFEDLNFTCSEAEDGEKALQACRQAMPDLIMLDWNMPVMNGLEFLQTLRATPEGVRPTVLFCTTENGMEAIERGIQAGANEYIMKPFDKDLISIKLSQLGLWDNGS